MLLTKEVEVTLGSKSIKWYEDKGYEVPRIKGKQKPLIVEKGTKIKVKTEDLQEKSRVLVDVECDGCRELLIGIRWSDYTSQVKEDGKYYCVRCGSAGFKHWVSFYEWCYNNLDKDKADIIINRWNDDLNIDKDGNKLSPKDVSYASSGFNKKGYWFNCLDNIEHKPEQKRISAFTGGQKGSLDCDLCNTIFLTHPHLISFFVNKDDAHKYSFGSGEYALVKCPDCDYEKTIKISNLVNHGFGCNRCGDGVSIPEKVMINVLEQLFETFIIQLSKTTFGWCNNYRYDLYINRINGICECQGNQHYEETRGKWGSLDDIQENDLNKEWLARENSINHYIILDCRKSELEWIKNSIMNSKLQKLLNFKEEDIDWLKVQEAGCRNLVKVACGLWNEGLKSIVKIGENLSLSSGAIRNYLKKGTELGWCNYNPKEEICEKVICITTGEIFNSIYEASLNGRETIRPNISACCKGKHKSAGKSITGEPLVWMYYNKYLLKTGDEIKSILSNAQVENYKSCKKKVTCLTTNEIFESMLEASIKYNISANNISRCCSDIQKSAGIHPETGEKMVWKIFDK